MTGYFSATALALAARGVGCTLSEEEVRAIEHGYDLRRQVNNHLAAVPLMPPDLKARNGLEALAWMISRGRLGVMVAVTVLPDSRPTVSPGIYYEKAGIVTDGEGSHPLSRRPGRRPRRSSWSRRTAAGDT